jgi:hypothetical protein
MLAVPAGGQGRKEWPGEVALSGVCQPARQDMTGPHGVTAPGHGASGTSHRRPRQPGHLMPPALFSAEQTLLASFLFVVLPP